MVDRLNEHVGTVLRYLQIVHGKTATAEIA